MSAKTYKNPYTLDGRLKFGPGTSQKKVEAAHELIESALGGNHIAGGKIKEALTSTSDFVYNMAQVVNATVLPELDEDIAKIGDQLADVRRVTDFRNQYLYTFAQNWNAGVVGDGRVNEPLDYLPTVPEATPYPEAIFAGELIENSGIRKTGLRTGITWEALVNDTLGVVQALPGAFRNLALNTIERDVQTTLFNGVGEDQAFLGGTSLLDQTVAPNAPISRPALEVAIRQLRTQYQTAYKGAINGGFDLLVAVGQGDAARFLINSLSVDSLTEGNLVINVSGGNPLASINVIESVYITDPAAWYLKAAKGSTARPILDRLTLVGHEQAELRVNNLTGNYVGGSSVPPFEGSFIADTADWRVRLVTGAVLWSPYAVVYSDGSGVA